MVDDKTIEAIVRGYLPNRKLDLRFYSPVTFTYKDKKYRTQQVEVDQETLKKTSETLAQYNGQDIPEYTKITLSREAVNRLIITKMEEVEEIYESKKLAKNAAEIGTSSFTGFLEDLRKQ